MTKKCIAALAALTVLFLCCFGACNKGTYKNPATDQKYQLVTDENGDKILSDSGELLVYVTDENGKAVTNENGEPETAEQGFIGQLVDGNVVEDFGYIVTLPSGWKFAESGDAATKFTNASRQAKFNIHVLENTTYDDYYQNALNVKESFEENGITVSLDEVDIPNANTTGVVMSAVLTNDDGAQEKSISAFYENNGNLFSVNLKTTKLDSAEALFTEFLSAISYKPYRYFEEVTTTADDTAEAASETESTTAA
jgi:hypothetical protein